MVTLAGLINALKIVRKQMKDVSIAFIGSGAANIACSRMIFAAGAQPENCRFVDTKGILHKGRADIEQRKAEYVDKWRLCNVTNKENRVGSMADAIKGADVVIAMSQPGPGTIQKEWIATMAKDAVCFCCANPIPEIWPWEAQEAGAVVFATGRSDFPNQVNNSLGFPGIFRGTLDVRAKTITDEMCIAAAEALAKMAEDKGLAPDYIIPTMDEWEVFPREAVAVAMKAQEQGIARIKISAEEEFKQASAIIKRSRDLTQMMMREGFIAKAD
jgi:malate dehydrogenase (oxaloacetate-decarboxylating)